MAGGAYCKSVNLLIATDTILTTDKRARLIEAAVRLAYRRGFGRASLADIAKEAQVSPGNVYYYFKTKDEIGHAIVEHRMAHFRTQLAELNQLASPQERLCGFVQISCMRID